MDNKEDNKNDNEWNIVDNQQQSIKDNESIPYSNTSQSIIIGTLNNRLNDISEKMDIIITKLDCLDTRIKNIEEYTLNKSEYDQVIFNNTDISKILNLDEEDIESIKTNFENSSLDRRLKTNPITITPRTQLISPNIYDSTDIGLKYFSNKKYNFNRNVKSPFTIPFSAPY